jgi:hypothetical protein
MSQTALYVLAEFFVHARLDPELGASLRTAGVDVAHQPVNGLGHKVSDLNHARRRLLEAPRECLLKPHAARAEDVLVEVPCSVAALDRHV